MKWVRYTLLVAVGLVVLAVLLLLLLGGARGETRLQATIEIARPPSAVFDWITDPARVQSWVGWLIEVRPLTPGPSQVGTRELWVMEDRNNNNQRMEIESEIIALREDRALSTRVHAPGLFTGTVTYGLEPVGANRTLLQYLADYRYEHWLARLLEPIVSRAAQQKLEEDLARLKNLAERS